MSLFNKKEKKEEEKLPKLPSLPKLPELKESPKLKLPKLPAYPTTQLGEELSKNTIKEAINGKKEEEVETNDFVEKQMMSKPLELKLNKKLNSNINKIIPSKEYKSKIKQKGPIFIRVDKFQESLEIFEEAKDKIMEMEKMLEEIKQIKENEEKELSAWENEILLIKNQIEKVEKDIFSKIE